MDEIEKCLDEGLEPTYHFSIFNHQSVLYDEQPALQQQNPTFQTGFKAYMHVNLHITSLDGSYYFALFHWSFDARFRREGSIALLYWTLILIVVLLLNTTSVFI